MPSIATLTDWMADSFIAIVDEALTQTVTAAAVIRTTVDRVKNQASFLTNLASIRTTAASSPGDADLEEEAATEDALVVRQQLTLFEQREGLGPRPAQRCAGRLLVRRGPAAAATEASPGTGSGAIPPHVAGWSGKRPPRRPPRGRGAPKA